MWYVFAVIERSVKTGSTGNSSSRESTPGRETTPLSSSVPAASSAASVTAATADNDDDQVSFDCAYICTHHLL